VDVMRNQEFLLLPPGDIATLLASEDINVPNEETVFHSLIMWVKHDVAKRSQHLGQLLAHVKLPLLSPQVSPVTLHRFPLSVMVRALDAQLRYLIF